MKRCCECNGLSLDTLCHRCFLELESRVASERASKKKSRRCATCTLTDVPTSSWVYSDERRCWFCSWECLRCRINEKKLMTGFRKIDQKFYNSGSDSENTRFRGVGYRPKVEDTF